MHAFETTSDATKLADIFYRKVDLWNRIGCLSTAFGVPLGILSGLVAAGNADGGPRFGFAGDAVIVCLFVFLLAMSFAAFSIKKTMSRTVDGVFKGTSWIVTGSQAAKAVGASDGGRKLHLEFPDGVKAWVELSALRVPRPYTETETRRRYDDRPSGGLAGLV